MNVEEQIQKYITSQPEPKRSDLQALHRIILEVMPACKLWFLDGKNSESENKDRWAASLNAAHFIISAIIAVLLV